MSQTELTPDQNKQLDLWFTYLTPLVAQEHNFTAIRVAARHLAEAILLHTPASADQSTAIRQVWEAVMLANVVIATHPSNGAGG